jgi:hypothetical protein
MCFSEGKDFAQRLNLESEGSNAQILISGPEGSGYFSHPWMFQTYIPDVMVCIVNSKYSL